jgi:hypothetical protein
MSTKEILGTIETGGLEKGKLLKGRRREEVTDVLCI